MPSEPARALVIAGLLAKDPALFDEAETILGDGYGRVIERSADLPFDFTHYYEDEMGAGLLRRYLAFEKLAGPGELPRLKEFSGNCEKEFLSGEKRSINIDPGYLDVLRVVLASGKDSPHRIYIANGIYGEIEYLFIRGTYSPLQWTYPDYKSAEAIAFFNRVRKTYLEMLRKEKGSA